LCARKKPWITADCRWKKIDGSHIPKQQTDHPTMVSTAPKILTVLLIAACTALVAIRRNDSQNQASSSSLSATVKRRLQSSFDSFDFSGFNPGLQLGVGSDFAVNLIPTSSTPIPAGNNPFLTGGGSIDGAAGNNFAQGADPQLFFGAAGGNGGGSTNSFGGGSIVPSGGLQTVGFNGTNTGFAQGFAGGFVVRKFENDAMNGSSLVPITHLSFSNLRRVTDRPIQPYSLTPFLPFRVLLNC
jgi:hypothetical protein